MRRAPLTPGCLTGGGRDCSAVAPLFLILLGLPGQPGNCGTSSPALEVGGWILEVAQDLAGRRSHKLPYWGSWDGGEQWAGNALAFQLGGNSPSHSS